MRTRRLLPFLLALWILGTGDLPAARADGKVPGEAAELTAEVRATAQKHLDAMAAAKEPKDAEKAQRALLVLGPAVWPVVENAMRLTPPEAAKPRMNFLKAMLSKKAEPEFEYLRERLRVKFLGGAMDGIRDELLAFRQGRPDPKKPGKKIPPTVKSEKAGTATVYRSGDGSIVIGFGADGTAAKGDAGAVTVSDPAAGFVAAVGGRAMPHARQSGAGADAVASAPMGFAYAYASDGAEGMKPGGDGGQGGSADAKGGAGEHGRSGNGGAGAPG